MQRSMSDGSMKTLLSESVFDVYADEYEEWFERNRFAYLSELKLLRMLMLERGRGLEIGIGTGRFAAPLCIDFGIDPSSNMLQMARNLGIRVALAKGEHLPFKNEVFDYVLIMVTICFVDDPNRVVEESMRVLKNGGRIVIGIIDKDSWLGKLYLTKKDKSKFYREAKFFSVREVMDLLKGSDFKDVSVYQTIFDPLETIRSVQHYKEGSGEGGFAAIYGRKTN